MKKIAKKILIGPTSYCDFSSLEACFLHLEKELFYDILVLEGRYVENLRIYQDNFQLTGLGKVVITGKCSAHEMDQQGIELGTFQTPTVFINGKNICLKNLTIENTAGPGEKVQQAVALYLEGTDIFLENCRLLAFQDTLCLGPLPSKNKEGTPLISPFLKRRFPHQKSFFKACYLEGTVDFIFGGGEATFFNCELFSKKRLLEKSPNFLTAPATEHNQEGFLFQNCFVHGDQPYYLGRPWRQFGQARFENCFFDEFLLPRGWNDWENPENQKTCRFKEIGNYYATAPKRATWINFEE